MLRYDAILFDFDYTLADSSEGVVECMQYALEKTGFSPVSAPRVKGTIGMSLFEAFRLLTGSDSRDLATEFVDEFIRKADEVVLNKTFILDGVADTVSILKSRGLLTGIVSTKFRYRIEDVLQRDGLSDLFGVIIGGEDVLEYKPDPEGLHAAILLLGVNKDRTLYVGDSLTDAVAAQNAEVDFIAVLTGVTTRADFSDYAPRAIIDDLRALPVIIDR